MQSPPSSVRHRLALLSMAIASSIGATAVMSSCNSGTGPVLPYTPTTQAQLEPNVQVVEGRPLRRRRGRIHFARSRSCGLWITDVATMQIPPAERTVLADYWRRVAEMEHASVIAFDDLARRLARVGADPALVARARVAASQEMDHAGKCFALASRFAGREIAAGHLRRPHRRPRSRIAEITALAVEALRDGVVNEGYAAWLAAAQLDVARDEAVRETLATISADEACHAELSRDVVEWCLIAGGAATRHAVDVAHQVLPIRLAGPAIPAGVDTSVLADHGFADVDPDAAGYRSVLAALVA